MRGDVAMGGDLAGGHGVMGGDDAGAAGEIGGDVARVAGSVADASGVAAVVHRVAETPRVSVLMPARDAARHIRESIEALLAGDWPAERLELVVAVGPSGDGTRELVAGLAARERGSEGARAEAGQREPTATTVPADDHRSPDVAARAGRAATIVIVDNPAGSTPAGLNAALRASTGDVIIRLDAHAVPAPDYVARSVAALRRTGAWVVGGTMVGRGETAFGRAVAIAQGSWLGSGGAAYRVGRAGEADTVYLGAWPRAVLEALGGWDERAVRNQDAELCLRIAAAGGRIVLDPSIRTTTLTRGTPRALAGQYFGYGAGRAATVLRHPGSLRVRQVAPAAFVAVLVGLVLAFTAAFAVSLGAAVVITVFRVPAMVTLASLVYEVAVRIARTAVAAHAILAGGYLVVTAISGIAMVTVDRTSAHRLVTGARIALALVIMHMAWGMGFWSGIVRGLVERRR